MARKEAGKEAGIATEQFWLHLALGLLLSFSTPAADLHEAVTPYAPAPRISDTATAVLRQDSSPPASDASVADWTPATGSDVTATTINFDSDTLTRLINQGQVTVDHPEGGDLVLSLVSKSEQAGIRTLAVRSNNYPGTITARGDSFFATLATQRGVYAIEHRHGVSYLVDQRQLDLRITQPDYRHVPTV